MLHFGVFLFEFACPLCPHQVRKLTDQLHEPLTWIWSLYCIWDNRRRKQTARTDLLINNGRVHYSHSGASNHQSIESLTGHFLFFLFSESHRSVSPVMDHRSVKQKSTEWKWQPHGGTFQNSNTTQWFLLWHQVRFYYLAQLWIFESSVTAAVQFFKWEVVLFFFFFDDCSDTPHHFLNSIVKIKAPLCVGSDLQ